MKVLNAYAGIGGNRKLWEGAEVTAIEQNPKIAAIYQRQHPSDRVMISDAHEFILNHHALFDFIWSSPPCQTHSQMNVATRHPIRRYPDMNLYEEIIFLRQFFKGRWVVENVRPYYEPLIAPTKIVGRHCFWSNFAFEATEPPKDFNTAHANKADLCAWLGIDLPENIYLDGHDPAKILRNCVHPEIGLQIFAAAQNIKLPSSQPTLSLWP